jgi:hypothetical protein
VARRLARWVPTRLKARIFGGPHVLPSSKGDE